MGLSFLINRTLRHVNIHAKPEITQGVAPSSGQGTVELQLTITEKGIFEGTRDSDDGDVVEKPVARDVEAGIAKIEALQAVWGKHGFWTVAAG